MWIERVNRRDTSWSLNLRVDDSTGEQLLGCVVRLNKISTMSITKGMETDRAAIGVAIGSASEKCDYFSEGRKIWYRHHPNPATGLLVGLSTLVKVSAEEI